MGMCQRLQKWHPEWGWLWYKNKTHVFHLHPPSLFSSVHAFFFLKSFLGSGFPCPGAVLPPRGGRGRGFPHPPASEARTLLIDHRRAANIRCILKNPNCSLSPDSHWVTHTLWLKILSDFKYTGASPAVLYKRICFLPSMVKTNPH